MKIFRIASVLLLLLLPLISLSAYDQMWGANLDLNLELPTIVGSTFGLHSENTAGVWYNGAWSPEANIEFDAGVEFDFDVLFGLTTGTDFSFHGFYYDVYPELDKLNFYGNSGIFGYKAGRQLTGDPAQLILDVPFDGIDFNADIGEHIFTVGAGYSGLTFRRSAEYFMTETDLKRDSALSTPRMMEYLAWEMPYVTSWLSPSVYFLAVQDLTSSEEQADYGNERFNTMYLELFSRGFIGENFIYDLALVGQYGSYDDATVLGGIARLGFSWLPGTHSRVGVDLIGSSGDDWDRGSYLLGNTSETKLSQFLPVSNVSTQGFVVEFELGNLASLGAFYGSRPSTTFSWEFRTTTFLRTAIGPTSAHMVSDTTSTSYFMGQEGLFSFFWRPKSDFGWDMKVGLLYPGEPLALDSEIEAYFPVLFRLGFDWSWSF